MKTFSDRNWALIQAVTKTSRDVQPSDAQTRFAYEMDKVIDAARAEGNDLVIKIVTGRRAGEVWLVGSGFLTEIETVGERLDV